MFNKEIDCSFTRDVVCPHCGYEFKDSYDFFEYHGQEADLECYECGKEFIACSHITIDYSSHKKK
jgi:DNA-directed RNA polymerase subunit RPC12/RpoP